MDDFPSIESRRSGKDYGSFIQPDGSIVTFNPPEPLKVLDVEIEVTTEEDES